METILYSERIFPVNNHTVHQVQGSLGLTCTRNLGVLEHGFATQLYVHHDPTEYIILMHRKNHIVQGMFVSALKVSCR